MKIYVSSIVTIKLCMHNLVHVNIKLLFRFVFISGARSPHYSRERNNRKRMGDFTTRLFVARENQTSLTEYATNVPATAPAGTRTTRLTCKCPSLLYKLSRQCKNDAAVSAKSLLLTLWIYYKKKFFLFFFHNSMPNRGLCFVTIALTSEYLYVVGKTENRKPCNIFFKSIRIFSIRKKKNIFQK